MIPPTVEAMHAAAELIAAEEPNRKLDLLAGHTMMELADQIAQFLEQSDFSDDEGEKLQFDNPSVGYGLMVGFLAARAGGRS